MATRRCDVTVIGAGIVGCSAAFALTRRGLTVALLDAGVAGRGTSGATFAWINATSKTSDEDYFRLNAEGLAMYRGLARRWRPERIGLHQTGMLEWAAPTDTSKMAAMRTALDRFAAWSYPASELDRGQLCELEPAISFEDGAWGYHVPGDCWLDVPVFLDFLKQRLGEAGACVMEGCAAVELVADEDARVVGVRTERGRIDCAAVVVATGPDTPEVLARLTGYEGFATRFPVHRAPGLLVDAPAGAQARIRHIAYTSDSTGLHLRPAGDGRLLVAAHDTDGMISEGTSRERVHEAATRLLRRVSAFLPAFEGSRVVDRSRIAVGDRVVPADGRTIAGPALSAEGLYLAVTHSGVTLALVLAELLAESIDGGAVPARLEPYGLDRFG